MVVAVVVAAVVLAMAETATDATTQTTTSASPPSALEHVQDMHVQCACAIYVAICVASSCIHIT